MLAHANRWCPEGHPFKSERGHGTVAERNAEPPEYRTHSESVQHGRDADDYKGPENGHPRHTTGINGSCALVNLFHFDIIWDICPDMMHIIKNFFEKLSFKVFNGSRVPRWSDHKNKKPKPGEEDYTAKMAAHSRAKKRWEEAVTQHKQVAFSAADQSLVDRRVKHLVGPARWIKKTMVYTCICANIP